MYYEFLVIHAGRTMYDKNFSAKWNEAVEYVNSFVDFDCDKVKSKQILEREQIYVVTGYWRNDETLTYYILRKK